MNIAIVWYRQINRNTVQLARVYIEEIRERSGNGNLLIIEKDAEHRLRLLQLRIIRYRIVCNKGIEPSCFVSRQHMAFDSRDGITWIAGAREFEPSMQVVLCQA